jgi:drug/metabolite transporter (DMT)-like permease
MSAHQFSQYTQIIFALIIERVVWGTTPPVESLIGSLLIIGAAVWVSLQKNKTPPVEETRKPTPDEESPLLGSRDQTASSRE